MSLAWISAALAALADEERLRRRIACHANDATTIEVEGRRYANFASNDYLGLATDERLCAAARGAIDREGFGSAASPLITGRRNEHAALEAELAAWKRCEAAIVFASGFAANVGAITALVGPRDAIFSDAKNHASIIDGCRLSKATLHVYRHNDVDHLVELLARDRDSRRRLIVTDSLFSMDGDFAPLAEIAELAARFGAMLMVDEAHATGLLGKSGSGLVEALGLEASVHVRVGTLSKALGAAGGFISGSRELVDWLANRARGYIFSTSLPAATCAAARAALEIVRQEPDRRTRLNEQSARFRAALVEQGWDIGDSQSQIVPLVVGDEAQALALSAALREAGFWAPAIRPPSVAPGESRVRLSLSSAHDSQLLTNLLAALGQIRSRIPQRAAQI